MDSKLSSVIDRVQKLLALSKSSNVGEAANAAAAANKLIDTYRLSAADIETDNDPLDPITQDDSYIYETGRITLWKNVLIHVLSRHYGCAFFNDTDYTAGRKVSRYRLVGRQSDIQICRYMFTYLNLECSRLSDLEAKGRGRVFVSSYCEGFVNGIDLQLQASRAEAQAEATSNAIVRLDARFKESTEFMHSQFKLKTISGKSHAHRDVGAYSAGQQKGKSIHLGKAMSGSSTKLLGN